MLPFSICIVLNDLQTLWKRETFKVFKLFKKHFEEHLNIYLKLFVLLSVEDAVVMTESAIIGKSKYGHPLK